MTHYHLTLTEASLKLALAEMSRQRRDLWRTTGKKAACVLHVTLDSDTQEVALNVVPVVETPDEVQA